MKILNCILTLSCLGGLVSCHPVAVNQHGSNSQGGISADSSAADAKRKAEADKKKVSYHDVTTPDYSAPSVNGLESPDDNIDILGSKPNEIAADKKLPIENKPVVPTAVSVKTAKKVPNRDGFVFNPYTYNQVDVRGIPSGTKVRDPHDSNPAHVFRVP